MASIRKRRLPTGRIRWQVDFKDGEGKRRAKLFTRKKDADAYLVDARARVAKGSFVHDVDAPTLEAAAYAWLAHCKIRCDTGRRMERATLRDYSEKVRLHILSPELGLRSFSLSHLKRKTVNEYRDSLLASGRPEATARKALTVLRLVLNHAVDNGQISENPAQGVRVIRSSRIQAKVALPSKEDVRMLIEGASNRLSPHRSPTRRS